MTKKMGPKGNSPVRVMAATNRSRALKLRLQGLDFESIAQELGCERSTACGYVKQALEELAEEGHENVVEIRRLELARLDSMLHALQPAIKAGDTKSIDSALKIQDRRAKLLGLDKEKAAPTNVTVLNLSVEELVSEARRLGVPVPVALLEGKTNELAGRDSNDCGDGSVYGPRDYISDSGRTEVTGTGGEGDGFAVNDDTTRTGPSDRPGPEDRRGGQLSELQGLPPTGGDRQSARDEEV